MKRFLLLALTAGLFSPLSAFAEKANRVIMISSGSMIPTLQKEDRIIVNENAYLNRSPQRGDIISFASPFSFDAKLISNRKTPLPSKAECKKAGGPAAKDRACQMYIQRIVAIGGDQVFVTSKGELYLNGKLVIEPYYPSINCPESNPYMCLEVSGKVPNGSVLVLGDNRGNSWDSRFWPSGPFLPIEKILGRAETIVLPLERAGSLRGD